jgi:hypothetical protein
MNFHIMDVEPLGSVVGGGESDKVSQALDRLLCRNKIGNDLKVASPDSLKGVWRSLFHSFATSKFFK